HGSIAERHREGKAFIPGVPLVHVVRAEELARLSGDDIKGAGIEVGEVNGHALGWAKACADLLDGSAVARLRNTSRACPSASHRNAGEYRMLQDERMPRSPFPVGRIKVAGSRGRRHRSVHGGSQPAVVVSESQG